jgi:hypothetical protein
MKKFWDKVNKSSSNGCWEWTASTNGRGYGRFNSGKENGFRLVGAHRLSYIIKYGPISDEICVLHKCDNRKCVNPDHLFLGTHADNALDKASKGRVVSNPNRGSKSNFAKLKENQVRQIKNKYRQGVYQKDIAAEYGITQSAVSLIIRGKNWAHL